MMLGWPAIIQPHTILQGMYIGASVACGHASAMPQDKMIKVHSCLDTLAACKNKHGRSLDKIALQ